MKKIIINADDFGISSSANQAIAELYNKGIISSATIMTNLGKSSAEAVALTKKYKIPVGLHLNLTVNNPYYKKRADFEKAYLTGRIDKTYIKKELTKQWDYLIQNGITPTHIDSHQHVHTWPGIFFLVCDFAKKQNIPVRLPLEYPVLDLQEKISFKTIRQLIRKVSLLILGSIDTVIAGYFRVKTSRYIVSLFCILPRPKILNLKHYSLLFKKAKNRAELMCHPITSAEGTQTSITDYSLQEYNLMTKPEFLAMIKKLEIKLINFGGL